MYAERLARRYALGHVHEFESKWTPERGFTLIELLIVIVVLGILAAIVIFALGGVNGQAAVSACKSSAKSVQRAVSGYEIESGTTLSSLDALTQGPNPYLQSLPSSSHYAFSIQGGVLMVAAPASASPVDASSAGACSGAAQEGASPTTTSPTTTTTSPPSTTTTTTTTIPQSNGVSATGKYTYARSGNKGTEVLTLSNVNAISALSITIDVAPSSGETITFDSEKYSFTKKNSTDAESALGSDLSYTYVLGAGDTIAAGSGGTTTAVFTSTISTHVSSGDTWSVTSTSNNIQATVTGTF